MTVAKIDGGVNYIYLYVVPNLPKGVDLNARGIAFLLKQA